MSKFLYWEVIGNMIVRKTGYFQNAEAKMLTSLAA
jgi:hypothetical protein